MTASEMGKKGGRLSAEKRLGGMTKEQKSEHMRSIRYSKVQRDKFEKMDKSALSALKEGIKNS